MPNQLPAPDGVTFNLLATQAPLPLAPASFTGATSGGSGPFTQGMTAGVSTQLNILAAKVQTLSQGGAGGYGVLKGLDLAAGSGLLIQVSAGSASVGDMLDYGGGSIALPASQTSFLWLTSTGMPAFAATTTPPSGGIVYLGAVSTGSSTITGVDYSGRVWLMDGARVRQTADAFTPGDAPPATARVFTLTQNGMYFWNGLSHVLQAASGTQNPGSAMAQTLLANWPLTPQSANLQWLIAEAAVDVILPAAGAMPLGGWFKIVNAGDASIPAQDFALSVVTAVGQPPLVTLNPGQSVVISVQPSASGSGPKWPPTATAQTGV